MLARVDELERLARPRCSRQRLGADETVSTSNDVISSTSRRSPPCDWSSAHTVSSWSLIVSNRVRAQSAQPGPSVDGAAADSTSAGVFQPVDGQPPAAVEIVTLSVYAEPDGGAAGVAGDADRGDREDTGRFTLLLGASDPDGIPAEVFASGDAQWMSLLFERAGRTGAGRACASRACRMR